MNKVYRSVWNASAGTWVAVPETAKSGRSSGQRALSVLGALLLLGGASQNVLAACASPNACSGSENHYTSTDGALSGDWTFSGTSILDVNTASGAGTGTHTFSDTSILNVNALGGVSGATINLHNGSELHVRERGGLTNSTINLHDQSFLYGISAGLAGGMGAGNTIVFNNGGTFQLGDSDHEVNVISGNGAILATAGVPTQTGVITLTVKGDGTTDTHSFSGKLGDNTLTGQHSLHLVFEGGNWDFTGVNTNTGQLTLGNGVTLTSHGYQDVVTGNNGSVFKGDGSVKQAMFNSGATISPGLNTMQIQYFLLNSGSTYEITANDSGSASRIEATNLTLNRDAKFHINALSGNWSTTQTYEILTANNIATGANNVNTVSSNNITSNFAYLTPVISTAVTGSSGVFTLTLTPNNVPNPGGGGGNGNTGLLATHAQTSNQIGVANAVESLGSSHPVYNHVLTLPAGAPAETFNSLSGEAHASIVSGLPNLTSNAYRLPMANLRHSLNAGLNPAAATAQVGGTQGSSGLPAFGDKPAWVELVGNWQNVDGDSNAGSLDQNSVGVFAGYDNDLGNGWYLGGALGYTQTDADVSSRDSEADIHSYSATLYGGKAFALDTQRQLNVLGGISYTFHDIDSERKVRALDQKLTAGYDAHTTQVFGEVGYLIGKPDGRYVEPFAGLTVSHLEVGSFKEKGGSAALKGDSDDDTQVVSSLGVRGQLPYEFGNFGATLRGSLAWQHAFGDEHMDATMRFVDGSHDFNVRGVSLERDTAVLGLGTQLNVSANAAISLDYEGRYASGLREHSASLKAQWNF